MSVTLHTTVGDIKIELYCEEIPKACENFLALCASGYYNNNVFHRNIKDFMVQTGDPTGTGKGGNSIWGEPFADELHPELKHDSRGVLSMANNGANTNKSQFFITYAKQAHLDLKYTTFGRVIDGYDALDELETIKVDQKYRPVVEQRNFISSVRFNQSMPSSSSNLSPDDRFRQMQEYFDQYAEEYYETDDALDVKVEEPRVKTVREFRVSNVDDIVSLLESERVSDIVVLPLGEAGPGVIRTMVICCPFNSRHGYAVASTLRQAAATDSLVCEVTKRAVRNNFGWFTVDIGQIQIHLMTAELRERFDLEGLWGPSEAEEETEDIPSIPPPKTV